MLACGQAREQRETGEYKTRLYKDNKQNPIQKESWMNLFPVSIYDIGVVYIVVFHDTIPEYNSVLPEAACWYHTGSQVLRMLISRKDRK